MSRDLYPYYERELRFLRQMTQEFARQYPATAGRLLLEPNRSADPHVERLIESCALLAGRVQHQLDAEFPELTDALLEVLYPHYLRPVPSFAVLQLEPDATRVAAPHGFTLAAGARVRTQPVGGLPLRYRTAYDVRLWPIVLKQADWLPPPFPRDLKPPPRTAAVLRLQLECAGTARFGTLHLDRLRFFLSGDPQLVAELYEALFNHVHGLAFRDPEPPGDRRVEARPDDCILPVGFGRDEGLLPYPPQSLPGYRLLTEYFAFPPKFHFVDLGGFPEARRTVAGRRLDVLLYLDRTSPLLEQGVDATTFRLGGVPIVNLFEQAAEPIPLSHARPEYRVVPDVANPLGLEVWSVDRVTATFPGGAPPQVFRPFYELRHGEAADEQRAFWHATRRPATAPDDKGGDVFLSLVDLDLQAAGPAEGVLVVQTTCTNRDLPERLRQSGERAAFDLEAPAPLSRVRCLVPPTVPLRPFARRGGYWRLVSHLGLNHFSLNEDPEALTALREVLTLYDFSQAEGERRASATRQLIEGLTAVTSRQAVRRLGKLTAGGFCRGVAIEVELDPEKYVGVGAYLFAAVLERFFALHATVNAFTQTSARLRGADAPFKTWPPRAGEVPLL
jgi:type VI secretion system protein ImpG